MYRWESKSGKSFVRWDAFTTAVWVEAGKDEGLSVDELDDLIAYLQQARAAREDLDDEPDRSGPDV